MDLNIFVTVIIYLVTFFVIFIATLWYLWSKKVKLYQNIPTPKYNLPILGHILRVPGETKKILDFQKLIYEEVKSKTRVLWFLFRPVVTTKDVKNVEDILKSSSYTDKGTTYQILGEWLGDGLLISDGAKWKSRRRLLTPAFHFDILKTNFEIMKHHALAFSANLKRNISDEPIEMSSVAKYFSLNVICETAMGVRCNIYDHSQKKDSKEAEYVVAVDQLLHMLSARVLKPWFHPRFLYQYFSADGKKFYHYLEIAKAYVQGVIEARIKALEGVDEINSNIFLDILISAYKKGEIDIEGIIEEVNTFMFEGHDTVSSAIAWTIYLLGRNKRVQNKLFAEIDNVDSQDVTFNDISQLKYLECVIKESLRIHPPVPGFSRSLKNGALLSSNMTIPPKTTFALHIYHMQHDKNYWDNPLDFHPERFSLENEEQRNPFSFVPFSAGPRNCIGQRFAMMELKIVIFNLIKNFQFISVHAEHEIEEHADVIHRSTNGLWVNVCERNM